MSAIPTPYRGHVMRSRLEARWAAFFDVLGLPWDYEPQGYELDGLRYLPDFWLPTVRSRGVSGGIYFEVKPEAPTEAEERKARMLAHVRQRPVLIAGRAPRHGEFEALNEYAEGPHGTWEDDGLSFGRCALCDAVSISRYVRDQQCTACTLGLFDPYELTLQAARKEFHERVIWKAA